jgi:hypothetical protein
MSPKTAFFFYLAAFICFLISAAGEGWKFGMRGRRGLAPSIALLPLGLALFVIPTLYDTFKAAWP